MKQNKLKVKKHWLLTQMDCRCLEKKTVQNIRLNMNHEREALRQKNDKKNSAGIPEAGEWRVVNSKGRMARGEYRMAKGEGRIPNRGGRISGGEYQGASSEGRVANTKWRVVEGDWRVTHS